VALPTITHAAGVTRLTLKAGVSANVGDLIGHDGTDFVLADADARIPAQYMAMESVAAGSTLQVCVSGSLTDTDAPYTTGADQYLSATAAGAHTATAPALSTTLTVMQRIGKAVTTSEMAFDLSSRGPAVLRANATVDPGNIGAAVAANTAVTVTGVATGDVVDVIPPTTLEAVAVQSAIATAANTITLRLVNDSAAAIDPASATWTFYVRRH
jgi:hypothetical protein